MKKKMGRPPLVAGQNKSVLVGVRVSPGEARTIQNAARRLREEKSQWARDALMSAVIGNRIPVNCPKAQAKYDEKQAVFYFMDGKRRIRLKGRFRVWREPTCVAIVVMGMKEGVLFDDYFHLPQATVNSIRPLAEAPDTFEVQEPVLFSPTH